MIEVVVVSILTLVIALLLQARLSHRDRNHSTANIGQARRWFL